MQRNASLLAGQARQGPHAIASFMEKRDGSCLGQPLAMAKDAVHV